jgi:hypothetical protein
LGAKPSEIGDWGKFEGEAPFWEAKPPKMGCSGAKPPEQFDRLKSPLFSEFLGGGGGGGG